MTQNTLNKNSKKVSALFKPLQKYKYVSVLISALLFSLGLFLSKMLDPNVVLSFLDITGQWNPSLAFVMIFAIATHALFLKYYSKSTGQALPQNNKAITLPLILGSVLFGTGWGLVGLCPGPAINALLFFDFKILIFLLCMLLGFYASYFLKPVLKASK